MIWQVDDLMLTASLSFSNSIESVFFSVIMIWWSDDTMIRSFDELMIWWLDAYRLIEFLKLNWIRVLLSDWQRIPHCPAAYTSLKLA